MHNTETHALEPITRTEKDARTGVNPLAVTQFQSSKEPDPEAKRRRALVACYSLLLDLADRADQEENARKSDDDVSLL